MINYIFIIFPLTALAYYPLFLEEFESPKAISLISFSCFAVFFIDWRKLISDKIAIALSLFTVSSAISSALSIDKHMSFFGNIRCPNGFLVNASYLVFYMSLRQNIKSLHEAKKILYILTFCAFVVSSYAMLQVVGIDFQGWTGVLESSGYTRPMSTLGHPNFMAAYLSMTFPFILYLYFDSENVIKKCLYMIVILTSITAIFLSLSRGMLISFLVGVFFYFAVKKYFKCIFYVLSVSLIILTSCFFISEPFKNIALSRYKHMLNPGMARIEYPSAAIRIWKRYPFFGIGTDAFEIGFQHQRTKKYWELEKAGSPHRAHNDFLNILATQGLFGALCSIFLTIVIFLTALKSTTRLLISTVTSIIVFYVQGLTSFVIVPTGVLFILCAALLNLEDF